MDDNVRGKVLKLDNINEGVVKLEYAVRGPILIRANEIQKELDEKKLQKPFTEVIRANLGDCHAMGQIPISYIRQVLVVLTSPILIDCLDYPLDVKNKAKLLLKYCRGGSIGSYTESTGIEFIRKLVAQYIEKRDGIPSNYDDIFLCAGASSGIMFILKLFDSKVNGKSTGVMIPVPQFPLYSASIDELGMVRIEYNLNEEFCWSLDIDELEKAIQEGKKICCPRVIVVINPGNPTGQVLTRENIQNIIMFAYKHRLFILADEVYQHNVYTQDCQFHSFKKIACELGPPYSNVEIASFMSASKGYMGECGLRGGYCELLNMDPDVKKMLYKLLSSNLCPTVHGQMAMACVVNPPEPGDESYDRYCQERNDVLNSLAERAKMVVEMFNKIPGFSCNPVQGAMYAFPKFELPQKAIEKAKSIKQHPDVFYAFQLLENTGICIVPGSGFGQAIGTFHFRTTILPQKEKLKKMLIKLEEFHMKFLEEYK